MAKKIIGWVLLVVGLLLIGWVLMNSYSIFTGKTAAPEIFKIETEETPAVTQEKFPTTPEAVQKEMEKMIEEQLKDVLPVDILPKMLNLAVWSMLAFIFIFGSGQLSTLGIKLIKK